MSKNSMHPTTFYHKRISYLKKPLQNTFPTKAQANNNINVNKYEKQPVSSIKNTFEDKEQKKIYLKRLPINSDNSIKKKFIICPECKEHAQININNYKISLFCSKNRHKTNNILLNEFEKTQNIDLATIKCENCLRFSKKDTEQNMFYRCINCKKNICPQCKPSHASHHIIDYDIKYYICDKHNYDYSLYCKKCNKNLCIFCQKNEHKSHEIIPFKSYNFNQKSMNKEIEKMREKIYKFKKEIITKLKDVLDNVSNNLDLYYKINWDIFNNFPKQYLNYEILSNINEINENCELKDIDKIIQEKNIINQFSLIYEIYQKMNSKDKKDNPNKINEQRKRQEVYEKRILDNQSSQISYKSNYNKKEKPLIKYNESNEVNQNNKSNYLMNTSSNEKNKNINNDKIREKEIKILEREAIEIQKSSDFKRESQNLTHYYKSKVDEEDKNNGINKKNFNDSLNSSNQINNFINNRNTNQIIEKRRKPTHDPFSKKNKTEANNMLIYQHNEGKKQEENNIKNLKSLKDQEQAQSQPTKKGNFVSTDKYGRKENIVKNRLAEKMQIDVKEKEIEYEKTNKPKGLYNMGLSCYMNSLLQCLYYIPELRDYFIKNKNSFTNDKPVCKAFAEVMFGLKNEKKDYFEANEFKKIMGSKNSLFSGYKAADAKDLYFNLIDAFLNELSAENNAESCEEEPDFTKKKDAFRITREEILNNNNIINELFIGYYETVYKCIRSTKNKQINTYYFSSETYILFNLERISNYFNNQQLTIEDCFDYNFLKTNKVSFFCGKCNKEEVNNSYDIIYVPPKILVLILDRGKGKKFRGKIDFKVDLDLNNLIDKKENSNIFNSKYKLIGVCTHSGKSSSSGHYTACCLADDGKYYYFSDTFVEKVKEKNLYENEPYLLFYKRLDMMTPN